MEERSERAEWVVVRQAVGVLRALTLRQVLAAGGIPVTSNARAEVLVPSDWCREAEQLLEGSGRVGEIFAIPGPRSS